MKLNKICKINSTFCGVWEWPSFKHVCEIEGFVLVSRKAYSFGKVTFGPIFTQFVDNFTTI